MRNTKILLFVIASLVAPLATSAEAQVHFSVGGGFTTPNSEVRDHLGNGYNFNLGLQVDVTPVIGIEGLYSFNGLGSKDLSINVFPQPLASGGVPTDISADMNMQVRNGEPRRAEAEWRRSAVWFGGHGRLLSAHQGVNAWGGLGARVL